MIKGINLLPVLVAAAAAFGIGMLWYSPLLFGKRWMALQGDDAAKACESKKRKGMTVTFLIAFLGCCLMAFIFAYVITRTGSYSVIDAVKKGILLWVGFVATVLSGSILWEGKPLQLYLINVFHYLVVLAVMGALLVKML